jgi:hypothetical protein
MPEAAGNTSPAGSDPTAYGREAVEHVLAESDWRGWEDMLEWLRATGPGDPVLSPGELRGLRQDAERAARANEPFTRDTGELISLLRRMHRREA